MKILITGIDGYIGTRLADLLLTRGHDVIGIDAGFYQEGWLYNGVSQHPRVITKDTRNITVEDLQGFDAVIHLADLSNDPLGQHNEENTYAINYQATVALAVNAKNAGVKRFVYSSSCSVYGIAEDDFVTEESVVHPQTAYAKCKVLAEKEIAKLADGNFSPVFLRNATVYGPSPRMRFDLVVNNLAGFAWIDKEIKMISDGTPWRPLVHILDVCEAFACALEAPRESVHNQIFNVGSTSGNYQIRTVAEIIASVFKGCTTSFGTQTGLDTRSYRVSFEKIAAKLPGFITTRDVTTSAQELYDLFRRIRLTKEQFEHRAFTRLKALEYLRNTQQIDERFFWRNTE